MMTHTPHMRRMLTVLPLVVLLAGRSAAAALNRQDGLAGAWQFKVDDGTYEERVELSLSGDQVRGSLVSFRHGYFSSRSTQEASFRIEGSGARGERLSVRLIDESNGGTRIAEIWRRGAYLIISVGGRDVGYARPGKPLVQSGEGSSEALALARAVGGRVYQTSTQVNGRGAFVGGRMRFALCSNGEIAYDESDLATTGSSSGGTSDLGRTVSRRGEWTVVLYAGAPKVMARWQGSGSSYSLTAYFDVRPSADGRSAEVDGSRLPVTGKC